MKRFEDFTQQDLWNLREEIVLNSLYLSDYGNTFDLDVRCVSDFFDGYVEYLAEMIEERDGIPNRDISMEDILEEDNPDNLLAWYECSDDYSWMVYYGDENDE